MKLKNVALSALLLALTVGLWFFGAKSTRGPKFDTNPYRALGAGVAEETAKLLGAKGRVVVITQDTTELPNPAIDGQLKAFEEGIQKKPGMSLAPPVRFNLTPMERMATGGGVPRESFLAALQSKPLHAVVLFCAFPALAAADYETLKQSGVKVVVASGYVPSYRSLLESRAIDLAVVPRPDRPDKTDPAASLQAIFSQDFIAITPETTAQLPY